jgi:CheY-like chemotaxis protein
MNGLDVMRQMKQQNPVIKIIAQTAYAGMDDKQKAYDAGCNDYVSKPLNREVLLSMINKHLWRQ